MGPESELIIAAGLQSPNGPPPTIDWNGLMAQLSAIVYWPIN